MTDLEWIRHSDQVLAIIVRSAHSPEATGFITPDDYKQQVGFVVHPAGERILPHRHREVARQIEGMSEVLLVRSGRCRIDLFTDDGASVTSRMLERGDLVVLVAGGHGFEMIEDTVLLEVKQGPYAGPAEKEFLQGC